MAETADEGVRAAAARIAHDLNNLLGVIGNYALFVHEDVSAAIAGDAPPSAAALSDIERIREATRQAALLTEELQGAARRSDAR